MRLLFYTLNSKLGQLVITENTCHLYMEHNVNPMALKSFNHSLIGYTITNFDTDAYLKYTEMIGEMACRFTWLSVLHFDEEYRQRQAAQGFAWGTEAPHLSTVTLRDRPAHSQVGLRRGGDKERQAGRDYFRQWNAGSCSYGAKCRFDHLCSTCGKDHPARDHAVAATTARATSA